MTTLDDKLMGEKTQNYCSSSSEDEGEDGSPQEDKPPSITSSKIDINSTERWNGYSQNTGPKGVIRDWQLYNEHQKSQWESQQQKLASELKKTTITVKSYGDQLKEQREKVDDPELEDLVDDDILQEFVKKRMEKLAEMTSVKAKFPGVLKPLVTADEFLEIIDKSDARVPVIIHIYENSSKDCQRLNECLSQLASTRPSVQFCNATAGTVGVSRLFRSKGLPALLVYKGGEMVGNFVQLKEEFGGDEFCVGDVENFLIEHGIFNGEK